MATTKSSRKLYRRRVKKSVCRGKRGRTCNKKSTCKYASGVKRSFCRSKRNGRVTRHSKRIASRKV